MEEKEDIASKTNQYFQKLNKDIHTTANIDQVMKDAEQQVEHHIEEGELQVPTDLDEHKKQEIMNQLLKKREVNPFQSRYRGFLLNSDREKNHQRYQIFKKIKQEYSKQKTAVVVKSVENKIKQWTAKKAEINKRKQRSSEKKKQIEIEILEELKKNQLEKKELEVFRKKEDLMKRLQVLEQKKEERQNLLKASSVRTKEIQIPKYKEIEKRFSEIEEKLKQQQEKLLQEKKAAMIVKKQEIRQHSQKYETLRKEKEEERKKKYKHDLDGSRSIQEREEFIVMDDAHLQQRQVDAQKRKRRKQFEDKVKSMVVLSKKDAKVDQQQNNDNNEHHHSKKHKRNKKEFNPEADPRKLGNDYLKQLKQKDKDFLGRSLSLPKISSAQPLSTKPSYKNYLTEIRLHIKRKQVGDQIQQVKQRSKSKAETYQQLTKKSEHYEQHMLKKIKELGRMEKYNDSVQKQIEIDELHARYIKMRLACIDV